jgi:hypothetical protein
LSPGPCNFGIKHYIETLNAYRDSGYHIGPVSDYFRGTTTNYDKHILLRHDVDLSLDYALELALLEKDNGTSATYYILLHSGLYNALSPEGRVKIRDIRRAGHEIGLHVDSRYYLGQIEFSMLEHIAECNVTTWCQHLITITPPLKMSGDAATIPYKYLSDSGMNYREGCICQHINRYNKLQILKHPIWTMVRPTGEASRWEILDALEEAAVCSTVAASQGFKQLVKEYVQVVTA